MDVAVVARKKTKSTSRLLEAFKKRGFSKAVFVNAKNLIMISKGAKTFARASAVDLLSFDSVFVRLNSSLSMFAEPLVEEIFAQKIFCNVLPGSFYLSANEPMQFTELCSNGLGTTKSVSAVNPESLKASVYSLSYPVIFKSFVAGKKAQAIIAESPKSLLSIIKSISMPVDGVLVKEFVEEDVLECVVVGEKVFAAQRKWNGHELASLSRAVPVKPAEWERQMAVFVARACRCRIATVKMVSGNITRAMPEIDLQEFNQKLGIDLEDEIALYYKSVLEGSLVPRAREKSFFDSIMQKLEELFHGRN